ncbi:MAG: ABC transporter substrate-binding protein [Verrucomicrobiota bacterium]
MPRFLSIVGCLLVLALASLTGRSAPMSGTGGRAVTDSTKQTVVVPANPQRVLSLCTSATDTLLRLGEGARLAGIDEYSRVVPGTSNVTVLGKGSAISREQVLARGIDLAFVWWFQEDAAKLLADLRVPVVRLRCGRASEVPDTIRLVGQCVGATNAADALARSVTEKLARLTPASTNVGPRVYLELYTPFKTSGGDSYLNDLIELAGGHNIAAQGNGALLLSAEQLLAADPHCVVLLAGFGTPEQFARRGGLGSLAAVKAGRVHILDRYYLVAGAGLPEGVAALRQLIQPESKTKH